MIDSYMKNLIHLVKEIPKKIGWGILGVAGLCTLVSCATMTEAQKITMAGNALMLSSQYSNNSKDARNAAAAGSLLTTYGQMQQQLDVAKAGKPETNVTVINNPPNYQNSNSSIDHNQNNLTKSENNYTPVGFFMYKKWVDFNKNKIGERDEFLGLDEPVYNLKELNYLTFAFYGGGLDVYDGNMNLDLWDMDAGKLINYSNESYKGSTIQNFHCESKYFLKSGKYKAVLNTANKETFSLDFEVIK